MQWVVAARNESVPQQESPVSADLTIANQSQTAPYHWLRCDLTFWWLWGNEDLHLVSCHIMKDIIWYTLNRQADGSYTVTAKAMDYCSDGKYEVFCCGCQRPKQVWSRKPLLITQLLNHLLINHHETVRRSLTISQEPQGFDSYRSGARKRTKTRCA